MMDTHPSAAADILILGAGTAGCVLAARLSASHPDLSILLIEAGEDRRDDGRVYTPQLARSMLGNAEFDWDFESEVEAELRAGSQGRKMKHPRGKMVGGTSAINSFAMVYPSVEELDAWAALGNPGWSWEEVKHCFRKAVTVVRPSEEVVEELNLKHNFPSVAAGSAGEGPIQATFPRSVTGVQKAWLQAFRELGLENTRDPLQGRAIGGGISTCHISGERAERSHAGVAYLTKEVRARENLEVVTGVVARRILFESGGDGEAVAKGVEIEMGDGTTREIQARREVILAAGVFGSPQLLELSGIGDARRLRKYDIDVVYDNPAVGENLQDHIRPGISFEAADDVPAYTTLSPQEAEKLYRQERRGPWAENAAYMFAYMPLAPFCEKEEMRRLQDLCDRPPSDARQDGAPKPPSAFETHHSNFVKTALASPSQATATAFLARRPANPTPITGLEAGKCITLCSMLSHPLSRGSTHITSAASPANAKPEIKFNYYTHPLDLSLHAAHVLALERLAAALTLIKPGGARFPPAPLTTLEEAKEYLRAHAMTNYHPVGTCAMVPEEVGGVVDAKLRVYGTGNVRVVDASVFPFVTRGNVVATVYAVAERGAEIIGEELGGR